MAIEKVKPIEFDYMGVHYELFFTRKSIQRMEKNGFDITKVDSRLASSVYELFSGAFYAKHRKTTDDVIERIFDMFSKKSDDSGNEENGDGETLFQRLMKLYSATLTSLLEDDEDDENLIRWN